jgi:hypothetical protein
MAAGPYIPAKNSLFESWALNFSNVIAANPSNYGLATSDATTITAAYTSWHAAYLLATSPSTRTPATVAAMATAKASSLITFRAYAQAIQANPGVSDMNKAAAGLTVRATGRTPIPTPTNVPILSIAAMQPGVAQINYRNSANPTSKQKPYGSIQVQLSYFIAPTGTPDPNTGNLGVLESKSPFLFPTPSGDAGKAVQLYGRFVTRRGLLGPWSALLPFSAP